MHPSPRGSTLTWWNASRARVRFGDERSETRVIPYPFTPSRFSWLGHTIVVETYGKLRLPAIPHPDALWESGDKKGIRF
jgi:hypothetical protein